MVSLAAVVANFYFTLEIFFLFQQPKMDELNKTGKNIILIAYLFACFLNVIISAKDMSCTKEGKVPFKIHTVYITINSLPLKALSHIIILFLSL